MGVKLKNGQLDAFLFERDWIQNERVERWPRGVLEIYMRLIVELWALAEPGIAPDDERVLARLARCSLKAWRRARPFILVECSIPAEPEDVRKPVGRPNDAGAASEGSRNGKLVHRRLVVVAERQRHVLQKQSEQRSGAAKQRWKNEKRMPGASSTPADATLHADAARNAARMRPEPEIDAARNAGVRCEVLGVGGDLESKRSASRADSNSTATAASRENGDGHAAVRRAYRGGTPDAERALTDLERVMDESTTIDSESLDRLAAMNIDLRPKTAGGEP